MESFFTSLVYLIHKLDVIVVPISHQRKAIYILKNVLSYFLLRWITIAFYLILITFNLCRSYLCLSFIFPSGLNPFILRSSL